jgi:hypothetical protein
MTPPLQKPGSSKPWLWCFAAKSYPDSRQKCGKPVLQGRSERAAEVGPECADNPAMGHVEAPKQECDARHQVQ